MAVWLDEAEINIGDSLIEKISQGIEGAEYLGVALSPRSVKSAWVRKELQIALSEEIGGRRLRVLPILLEECEIPVFLRDKLYVDFTGRRPYDEALALLLRALGVAHQQQRVAGQALTLERLHDYLKAKYPDRKQGDWNDLGHLLVQLSDIGIATVEGLDKLLWRAEPALEQYEAGAIPRLLGGLAATGAVRHSIWAVSKEAADTCPGGRQTYRRYHQFVRMAG